MAGPGLKRKLALKIVHQGEEITGIAPLALERACKIAKLGDENHRGVLRCSIALAHYTLRQAMPPGAFRPLLDALAVAERWLDGHADLQAVRKARSDAFHAIFAAEKYTTDTVTKSLVHMKRKAETGLDRHATTVVLRYAALGANYACGTVLLILDAIEAPTRCLNIPTQAAGAISYQRMALGPALGSELRAAAWAQAEWEASRAGASDIYPAGALAVQLFHEFLGCQWKDQSDGLRVYFEEFVNWALAPSVALLN